MLLLARSVAAGGCAALVVIGMNFAERRMPVERPVARWFFPGQLGSEPGSRAPAGSERAYLTRAFSGLNSEPAQEWGRRNGLTAALSFSHNLNTIVPADMYDRHPEFFPLERGERHRPPERPYYWNPDIAREDMAAFAAEAARKHFTAHPAAESFSLGINDALIWGESPELLALATPVKWFRERPDYSPVVFTFMNRAATHLERTHPQKHLGALAYYWAENVPPFPVHRQVTPFLTADRSQGYDAEFWREELALQKAWGERAGRRAPGPGSAEAGERRAGIYDYIYGGGFLIPRIHTRLLAEHLEHARGAGFTDYFAEVNPNWGLDGPMPWLVAQLLRDPRQSHERLLEEYYRRCFGGAAEPMRRFFERCEELWMTQEGTSYWLKHYRNESQATLFPPEACRELRALLEAAGEAARTSGAARVAARVRLVSESFGVTERLVAFHDAREALFRATVKTERAEEVARLLSDFVTRRDDFVGYTEKLRSAQPHALHPIEWRDYLKNDPVPAALLVLREKGWKDAPVKAGDERALWNELRREAAPRRQLLVEAALDGPLQPPRMIAGLTYGVGLPKGWQSRVEPVEFHRAEVTSHEGRRMVRIAGTKDTQISQWVALSGSQALVAAMAVRGRVSPSGSVSLVVGFLDAKHRHISLKALRLPEGEWADWVELRQAVNPPPNAAWVGFGLRVQHQSRDDWMEARGFSLTAAVAR